MSMQESYINTLEQPKIRRVKLENSGKTFGNFVDITFLGVKPKSREAMYLCECKCGKFSVVSHGHLSTNHTTSCGCRMGNYTHGLSGTPEYEVWEAIKERCKNPNSCGYAKYGGSGIDISPDMHDDFTVFLAEVGKKPGEDYSIDRLDNTKGYVKGNIRWATSSQQACNKGLFSTNKSGVKGVHRTTQRGVDYYVASIEYGKIKRNKYFNVGKLGEKEALRLASLARDELERQMNSIGADFKQYNEHKKGLQ